MPNQRIHVLRCFLGSLGDYSKMPIVGLYEFVDPAGRIAFQTLYKECDGT
jgi:hypothetical protein